MEILLVLGLVGALCGFSAWGAYRTGKARPEAEIAKQNLRAAMEAKNVENAVNRLSNDDVSKRLSKWNRD